MKLTFDKISNDYTAEYFATTHFNLHIEGGGRVLLYKRTSGEQGDLIASIPSNVVDEDVAVNIPATYTIVLTARPSLVTITTAEGEVINAVIPEEDSPSGDAPKEITFTISDYQGQDRTFTVLEGMTWREFCDSDYNTEGWYANEDNWVELYTEGNGAWFTPYYYAFEYGVGQAVADRVINPDATYITYRDGGIGGGW